MNPEMTSGSSSTRIPEILKQNEADLLEEWTREQGSSGTRRDDLISQDELRRQSTNFLRLLREACQGGDVSEIHQPHFAGVRELLADISRTRARQGFTPSEVTTFIQSLKRPLFERINQELADDPKALFENVWTATELFDRLGLYTTEVYQKSREEVIQRQQQEMLELSTPVVKLWDGVLALPLIGTLDSARTQVVMESLLQRIVETGAEIAIIDITGVPTVDTLVAQHLMKTVAAARLMGADCIISGIRPQIAQTIVHLGVELHNITTKASLAGAFIVALQRTGYQIHKGSPRRDPKLALDAGGAGSGHGN